MTIANLNAEIKGAHAVLDKYRIPRTEEHDGDTITLSVEDRVAWMGGNSGTEDQREEARVLTTYGRLRGPLFDKIMDRVKALTIPYSKLSEQQQGDFLRTIRGEIDSHLHQAVRTVVTTELPTFTAKLGDFVVKSDSIHGKFETTRVQTTLEELGRHGLKPIHIVLADPKLVDDHSYEERTKPQKDQAHVDDLLDHVDNSDLADAGDAEDEPDTEGADAPEDATEENE